MVENPLRTIRLNHGLTQKKLSQLIDVTPQVILNTEQGLYGLPPSGVVRYLAELDNCSEHELNSKYAMWQDNHRYENRAHFIDLLYHLESVPPDYRGFRGGLPVAGFCKLLCINPAQWTRLEKNGGNSEFFFRAIEGAGLRVNKTA